MRLGLEVCELELSCSSFYKRHFGHVLNTMGAMLTARLKPRQTGNRIRNMFPVRARRCRQGKDSSCATSWPCVR